MAITCNNCGSPVASDDSFCGKCGTAVQVASKPKPQKPAEKTQTHTAAASERAAPSPSSGPNKKQGFSDSQKGIVLIGSVAAIAIFFYFTTRESNQTNLPRNARAVSVPLKLAPSKKSASPRTTALQAAAPSTSAKARSVTVEQHVEFIDALYEYVGLPKMGLKRSEFGSCAGCVPIILYCRKKVRKKTDIRGQTVAARRAAADFVRKYGDTVPQLLPLGEFSEAYKTGIVDCRATGGGQPKWALDGPLPPNLKRVNLPKSRLSGKSATNTGSDPVPARPAAPAVPLAPPAPPQKAGDLKSLEDF